MRSRGTIYHKLQRICQIRVNFVMFPDVLSRYLGECVAIVSWPPLIVILTDFSHFFLFSYLFVVPLMTSSMKVYCSKIINSYSCYTFFSIIWIALNNTVIFQFYCVSLNTFGICNSVLFCGACALQLWWCFQFDFCLLIIYVNACDQVMCMWSAHWLDY